MRRRLLIIFLFFLSTNYIQARENLKLILTTNIEGAFSPKIENQEKTDPIILLGQSILNEKRNGADLYIDLGNAFYPGPLAKYSYGSAVMDFFEYMGCLFTLVSSKDLRIGIDSLKFLDKGKSTKLLSANILQKDKNIFLPHYIYNSGNYKIAFIALSSKKILVNIAEKNVYDINLLDENKLLEKIIPQLISDGVTNIILLSGLNEKRNFSLLKNFKEIDLIISGGDNIEDIKKRNIMRVDIFDRRSIIGLPESKGYYLLNLNIKNRISIIDYYFKKSTYNKINTKKYREFINRITRWKKHFKKDMDREIISAGKRPFVLDDKKAANLLRSYYNAEIALVRKNTVSRLTVKDKVKQSDLISSIKDNYSIFVYMISGNDLLDLAFSKLGIITPGYKDNKVQGHVVDPKRMYKIVSTQWVYEMVERIIQKPVPYKNMWKNIYDVAVNDLKGKKVLLMDDFDYLENSFRLTVDFFLSNFYEKSYISSSEDITVPPGQSGTSYERWGMENRIDFTIYNRYHQFILTPYINFARQNDDYLQNLFRGTFLYNLIINPVLKAYHKSQMDTVIIKVEGLRPTIIRETIGADFVGDFITAKFGIGFEKHIKDPVETAQYGFESIIKIEFGFWSNFVYSLKIDSFFSFSSVGDIEGNRRNIRAEIENSLSYRLNDMLSISLKHKWFNFYILDQVQKYSNSQVITSFDFNTDFKVY